MTISSALVRWRILGRHEKKRDKTILEINYKISKRDYIQMKNIIWNTEEIKANNKENKNKIRKKKDQR